MANISWDVGGGRAVGTGLGETVSLFTAFAAAHRFASAMYTRYTYQPFQDLIHAVNRDTDIVAPRYHGNDIYDKEKGRIMTMRGEIRSLAMGKLVREKDEAPNLLSSVIVCLSVAMNIDQLSRILASAILIFAHGTMERNMEIVLNLLQGVTKKYAFAVLSRDSLCEKLKDIRLLMMEWMNQVAPDIPAETLFQPPSTTAEQGDFAEFLAELWNAQEEGVEIFTRSVKILGLALLLSEYGWHIDTYVEHDSGKMTPIKTHAKTLSVIFSMARSPPTGPGRKYVENHSRYSRMLANEFYPTAICTAVQMGEVSGSSIARKSRDRDNFCSGYDIARSFCKSYEFNLKLDNNRIFMTIGSRSQQEECFYGERDCKRLIRRFIPLTMPAMLQNLMSKSLCKGCPSDWVFITDEVDKQNCPGAPVTQFLEHYDGNSDRFDNLWVLWGAVLGVVDEMIGNLINLPGASTVRTPACESIHRFIHGSGHHLASLLSNGLEPGHATQLCAARLAGVDPQILSSVNNNRDIAGFWNAQQGILSTPIFERCLYCDLPGEKLRPLTFFNIPIEGMPIDDEGWIRPGPVDAPMVDEMNRGAVGITQPSQRAVVVEYRPHFEKDTTKLVAAAYVEGIFSGLLNLQNTLSNGVHVISEQCNHSKLSDNVDAKYLDLRSFQSGFMYIPKNNEVLIIGSHQDRVSRLFSSTIYHNFHPIIQKGCLKCAMNTETGVATKVIISNGMD